MTAIPVTDFVRVPSDPDDDADHWSLAGRVFLSVVRRSDGRYWDWSIQTPEIDLRTVVNGWEGSLASAVKKGQSEAAVVLSDLMRDDARKTVRRKK